MTTGTHTHSKWCAAPKVLLTFGVMLLVGTLSVGLTEARSPFSATVPRDFLQRHQPPIVLAVDGFSLAATYFNVDRQVAYLGPKLKDPANVNFTTMNAEIKTFGWSGDIRRTATTVKDLQSNILQAVEVAQNDSRGLAIICHSWGGILVYLALRGLEDTLQLAPGAIDLLITIHTPLSPSTWADPTLAAGILTMQSDIKSAVSTEVREDLRKPDNVRTWSNYYSSTDGISTRVPVATSNTDTMKSHTESYMDRGLLETYGVEIAIAVGKHDRLAGRVPTANRPIASARLARGLTLYQQPSVVEDNGGRRGVAADCPGAKASGRAVPVVDRARIGDTIEILDILPACGDTYFGAYIKVRTARRIVGYAQQPQLQSGPDAQAALTDIRALNDDGAFKLLRLESILCEGDLDCTEQSYAEPYKRFIRQNPKSTHVAEAARQVVAVYTSMIETLEDAKRKRDATWLSGRIANLYATQGDEGLNVEITRYKQMISEASGLAGTGGPGTTGK